MTRVLVISDVHANLPALEAVLSDAGTVDQTWCLGDIVGYGPDVNECVQRICSLPNLTCMMGNHDFAAIGNMPLETFNSDARKALLWQRDVLTDDSLNFLRTVHQEVVEKGEVSLVHGSPRDPIWEYILNTLVARINLDFFETPFCFVGHSHFQAVFQFHSDSEEMSIEVPLPGKVVKMEGRAIFNPGSVGQPRDRDPRAAYAIFEAEARTWEPKRVEYDIASVQKRIMEAGLPARHADRLSGGW